MDNETLDGLIKFRCTALMEAEAEAIAARNRRKAADQARLVFEDYIAKDKRDHPEFWAQVKRTSGTKYPPHRPQTSVMNDRTEKELTPAQGLLDAAAKPGTLKERTAALEKLADEHKPQRPTRKRGTKSK